MTAVDRIQRLVRELDSAPAGHACRVVEEVLGETWPVEEVDLYLADYGESQLVRVEQPGDSDRSATSLPIADSPAGRVYTTRATAVEHDAQGVRLLVPIVHRDEGVGVLGMRVRGRSHPPSDELLDALGKMLARELVIAARYCDVYEVARGARQLSLAAAIQWRMLPLASYGDGRVEVAGHLEPAYSIAGDSFDYAANADLLELALFDSMGHGIRATMLAELAVGAYRYSRRRRTALTDIAGDIDDALGQSDSRDGFVTGVLARLDLASGRLEWLSAGHPPLVYTRDGASKLLSPSHGRRLPFGLGDLGAARPLQTAAVDLRSGDAVVIYSDGITEARSRDGLELGTDAVLQLAAQLGGRTDLPFGEDLRQMVDAVLEHTDNELTDDATVLGVRWRG